MTSARPPNAASGSPPPGDLPEHRQVGRDAVPLLRPAACDPEAGDHLVEDEEGAARVAERPQRLEEAGLRRHDAHVPRHRLDEHRGEPLAVAFDRGRGRVDVVVAADTVSAVAPDGTPGVEGMPSVASPEPALASSASTWPW